jgi:hypothetical protein
MNAMNRYRRLARNGDILIRRVHNRVGIFLLALGLIGLMSPLMSGPAWAQTAGATVSGTVTDASGAVIPGCQLIITNTATGVTTSVAADAQGFYTAPNLIPGNYKITATAPGFSTEVNSGITLEVGAKVLQNLVLKVGVTTETVQVTTGSPSVELSSSTIGNVVSRAAVVDLPLNGRSWTDLSALQTGVATVTTQAQFDNAGDAAARANKGYGAQFSVGGARPTQNNYRIDGISVNDYANGAPANVAGQTAGVDAIEEFSVLTTNYTAEYGLTSGGVINAITRSGTNDLHGSAYEFIRNSALDAKNYFDPVGKIPGFRRNQFGGSIGGPIRKERTFFFANYEGLRQFQGVTIVNIVPSQAARGGTICSNPALALSTSPCTPTTVTVNPNAATYLAFYPLPNAGLLPTGHGDTGFFDLADPQNISDDFFTTRIDHKISEKDQIHGSYMFGRSPFTFPDAFNIVVLGFDSNRQSLSIEETHIFSSSLVNTARVGAFRQYEDGNKAVSVNNPLASDMSLGSDPGFDAARVSISGITQFSGGANAFGPQNRAPTNYQFYDDASLTRGKHSLKFGFALERQDFNFTQQPLAGTWSFGSLTSYLTNAPTSYSSAAVLKASAERGLRDTVLGGYVQDDWSWRPNVTFNLGFRYEMETNPTEVNGLYASLVNPTDVTPRVGVPFFQSNPTLRNAEPRVGFVWDPFNNGKTSVRGGFGFFDVLPLAYQWPRSMSGFAPFQVAEAASNAALLKGTFYNGVQPLLLPSTQSVQYTQQNPGRSYVMQRNFSLQRELVSNLTATVTYVGSGGRHLPFLVADLNGVVPTLTQYGYLYPNPIGSGKKINPNWGEIQGQEYIGSSSYNSLQAQLIKRVSHGIQFQASYTWGRSLDNSSTTVSSNDFNNSIRNPLFFAQPLLQALSDFNVSHAFVLNAIWKIPQEKSLHGIADKLVNGYQFSAIYKAVDGLPFTPTFGTGGNVAGFNNTASIQNDYPDRVAGPGCHSATHPQNPNGYINLNCFSLPTAPDMAFWTANCDHTSKVYGSPATTAPYPICLNLLGNAGRNTLIGPGLSDLDFSLFKNNYFEKGNLNVQFRWEVFNILNRPNFNPPTYGSTSDLYSAAGVPSGSAGVLTTTSTSSRQMQFALKFMF